MSKTFYYCHICGEEIDKDDYAGVIRIDDTDGNMAYRMSLCKKHHNILERLWKTGALKSVIRTAGEHFAEADGWK